MKNPLRHPSPLFPLALLTALTPSCFLFSDDDDDFPVFEPADTTPPALSYADPEPRYLATVEIPPNAPVVENVAGTPRFSVEPELPDGLALDPDTGVLRGTPTTAAAPREFEVVAGGDGESAVTTLTIEIVPPEAPRDLRYPDDPATYRVGESAPPNAPLLTGVATEFAVAPDLPGGLAIDAATGVIAGTPTEALATTEFTVTASNPFGSTDARLSIEVLERDAAPGIVVVHADGTLLRYHRRDIPGDLAPREVEATGCIPTGIASAADGQFLYTACAFGDLHTFRLDEVGDELAAVGAPVPAGIVQDLAFHPSRRLVAVGGGALQVFTPDLDGRPVLSASATVPPSVVAVAVHPGRNVVYALDTGADEVLAFRLDDALTPVGDPVAAGSIAARLALHPDGDFLYVVSQSPAGIAPLAVWGDGSLEPLDELEVEVGVFLTDAVIHERGRALAASDAGTGEIHQFDLDRTTGALTPLPTASVSVGPSPSRLLSDPDGRNVYCVDGELGEIWTFQPGPDRSLELEQRARTRTAPVAAAVLFGSQVFQRTRWVLATSPVAGTVQAFELSYTDIAVTPTAQGAVASGAGAFGVVETADRGRVFVANEEAGTVSVFDLDAETGTLTPGVGPFAAGELPFELALEPSRRFLYVLDRAGFVHGLAIAADGSLSPAGASASVAGGVAIAADPCGEVLYVARAAPSELVTLRIDPASGALAIVDVEPIGSALSDVAPHGSGELLFLADEGGSSVHAFELGAGGLPALIATTPAGPGTSSIAVHPLHFEIMAANRASDDVSLYDLDELTGVLTERVSHSPAALGESPVRLAYDGFERFALSLLDDPAGGLVGVASVVGGDGQGVGPTTTTPLGGAAGDLAVDIELGN